MSIKLKRCLRLKKNSDRNSFIIFSFEGVRDPILGSRTESLYKTETFPAKKGKYILCCRKPMQVAELQRNDN